MWAFWELLEEGYNVSLQEITFGQAVTNGPVLGASGHGLVMNLKVSNEVGACGSGAIHVRNAACAAMYAASAANDDVRQRCRCPTVLLELAGPNLSISGSVFSVCGINDQLTPMVSLLLLPDSPLMMQAARLFGALRIALPRMTAFYSGLMQGLPPATRNETQLCFPYMSEYVDVSGGTVAFKYVSALTPRCFTCSSGPKQLLVKFCRSYSEEAHVFAASAGFAPELLKVEKLPGGWLMVVMEHEVGAKTWLQALVNSQDVRLPREAAQKLHEAGFVHGDLRSVNVLLSGGRVLLVDFEWAGRQGQASYPGFLNGKLVWPPGASDGQPITPEHDRYWVEQLAASLPRGR